MTWNGEERRGENLAINLMDQVKHMFDTHIREEMSRYDSIQEEVRRNRESSEARHLELMERISHQNQSTLAVVTQQNHLIMEQRAVTDEIHKLFKEAFPDGNASKHREAHEEWITKAAKEAEFWLDVKKKAMGTVITAAIMWVGLVLWQAFLQGPK